MHATIYTYIFEPEGKVILKTSYSFIILIFQVRSYWLVWCELRCSFALKLKLKTTDRIFSDTCAIVYLKILVKHVNISRDVKRKMYFENLFFLLSSLCKSFWFQVNTIWSLAAQFTGNSWVCVSQGNKKKISTEILTQWKWFTWYDAREFRSTTSNKLKQSHRQSKKTLAI